MLLADRRRIAAERLAAMRIAPPAERDGSMVETITRTVHHHLAMQAQDVGSGMWSVGVRTGATTPYRFSHTRMSSALSPVRRVTIWIGCTAAVRPAGGRLGMTGISMPRLVPCQEDV